MATPREIHRHIKSVKNIQQITKAMKMVAAARLRRAQEKAASSRPFAGKIKELLMTAVSDKKMMDKLNMDEHPLLSERPVKKVAYIIVSSDKGLAGAYNANLLKHAVVELMDKDSYILITVGRKAKDFFRRRGFSIYKSFFGFSDKPSYNDADEVARAAEGLFVSGAVDEVILVYTQFKSALSFTPVTKRLLPVKPPVAQTATEVSAADAGELDADDNVNDVIFEPKAEETLKYLVPYYVRTLTYDSIMQAAASELGARMTAMSSATENANDLLHKLEVSYNKARQAGITNEINEIVGGAEALQ
jgi:F-type H+-transporting ATPase subunit gamma